MIVKTIKTGQREIRMRQVDFIQDAENNPEHYDKVAGEYYANYGKFLVPTKRMKVYNLITDAREYGLEKEVITTAKYIKDLSPNRCLLDVFQQAFDEWVK